MEYLLNKAKLNNWEVQNNCCGKKVVFVPYNDSNKVIQHINKLGDKISIWCNHDYTLKAISFI